MKHPILRRAEVKAIRRLCELPEAWNLPDNHTAVCTCVDLRDNPHLRRRHFGPEQSVQEIRVAVSTCVACWTELLAEEVG